MNKDYYIINNKNLAICLSVLLNEDFYTFDDKRKGKEGKKCYSFKNTNRFRGILTLINKTRNN